MKATTSSHTVGSVHCHTTCIGLLFLIFIVLSSASAQPPGGWSKIDTVTAGDCDDTNPSLVHGTFLFSHPDGRLRMVFERRTATEFQIVSKHFNMEDLTWDSTEVVVSRSPLDEPQTRPDYTEQYISAYPRYYAKGFAIWQRRVDGRWKLFYSVRDTLETWTPATLLLSDSLDLTDAKIRPYRDSTLLITWKRASTILASHLSTPGISQPETLAVGTSDSIQYDVCNTHGRIQLAWTSGSPPEIMLLSRGIDSYGSGSWSTPETTLSHLASLPNPHLFVGYGYSSLLYERQSGTTRDIFLSYGWSEPSEWNVSEDSTSEDVNAQAFQAPFITKRDAHTAGSYPWTDVLVYEKHRAADSAMVFLNYGYSDTVRSQGHNRNICVGSQLWWEDGYEHVLTVWESNRSGRSHIYGRVISIMIGDVEEPVDVPSACRLYQSYPNPCNPSTTIGYRQSAIGNRWVRLAVYDLLGREVAVLVDEKREPGNHEVKFDGSQLPSGVYFYRMQVGEFVQTRKLLLLR